MPEKQPRALVDVDGTLTAGPGPTPDSFAPLNTGTRAFLGALKDRGYAVWIFSARSPVERVRQFLRQNDLMRYVDGVTRTKLPSRIQIDDRAVRFRGDFAATLAEIDDFRPHWETKHDYGFAGITVPEYLAEEARAIGKRIKPDDLHEEGLEKKSHVTVYFGLTDDDPGLLRQTIQDFGPVEIKIGLLGMFDPPKHDVLRIAIESEDLHRLHRLIQAKVPHVDTHPEYRPHLTIGYLKSGKASDYLMLDNPLFGKTFTAATVVFSNRKGDKTEIGIAGNQDFIDGRNSALDNAAMVAHDMGRPDIRKAINHLVDPPRGPKYG